MLLINLCLFSSLCHYRKFLFDRKHRWVQEKLVLLFHFPDRYLLSHANPLTPVMTSGPPTLFTITNVIIVIQGNNASTLGTHSNCCVYNYAFCSHLSLNFKTLRRGLIKDFSPKPLEHPRTLLRNGWQLVYKCWKGREISCMIYWVDLMTFRNARALRIMKYSVNNKRTAKDTRNDASTWKLRTAFSLATSRLSGHVRRVWNDGTFQEWLWIILWGSISVYKQEFPRPSLRLGS